MKLSETHEFVSRVPGMLLVDRAEACDVIHHLSCIMKTRLQAMVMLSASDQPNGRYIVRPVLNGDYAVSVRCEPTSLHVFTVPHQAQARRPGPQSQSANDSARWRCLSLLSGREHTTALPV